MRVLLISTYDLGRQPFGLASPAAWLRREGFEVIVRDVSRDRFASEDLTGTALAAFYLPMHTATRLAVPLIDRIRVEHPDTTLCAYGLYASLNDSLLRDHGVSIVLGPEAEEALVEVARAIEHRHIATSRHHIATSPHRQIARLQFIPPDRSGLPDLARYAAVQMPDGSARITGATEASLGCKHRCRHCPIVPVYDGQFRVVPVDVAMADIDQQVAAGAQHVTFGDPDFFNGPKHARRVIEALHERHPRLSYDVTIKIQHLLRHSDLLPILSRTGCLFVTSAVESVDDEVLRRLDKNHTRDDFEEAVRLTREARLVLAPTFVAFTPWTTLESYRDLLETVEELDLVEHVAPVQWALRLLITQGSRLLELPEVQSLVQHFDPRSLTYRWRHEDPRVDALQQRLEAHVGTHINRPRREVFEEVKHLAGADAHVRYDAPVLLARAAIPYLNEPWYC